MTHHTPASGPWRYPPRKRTPSAWLPLLFAANAIFWVVVLAWVL